ncbi:MAG: DUF4142 domain-containing protein [Pseudomonadota bacterium]
MKFINSFTTLKILTLAAAMSTVTLVDAQERTGAAATESPRAATAGNSEQSQTQKNTNAAKVAAKAVQTDGQILQVVRSLNNAEIDQAKHVLDESASTEVKVVAQAIIDAHEASNDKINDLLDGSLDLDDSDLNEAIQEQTEDNKEQLAKLEGAQLDCQYLQTQVEQHQLAIDTIKSDLTPDAQSADVKAFLTASAPNLESHVQEAQNAMKNLSGCSSRALSSN